MHIETGKLQFEFWSLDLAPGSAVKRVTFLPLALWSGDVIAFFYLTV